MDPIKLYAPGEDIPDSGYNVVDSTPTPALNAFTGTLGKAFDTALDLGSQYLGQKLIGSVYPTGSQNPAAVAAANAAAAQQKQATAFNWKPWAIGGGIFAGLIVLVAVVGRRK